MGGRPGGWPTPPPSPHFFQGLNDRPTTLPSFSGGLDPPMLRSKKKQPLLDSIKLIDFLMGTVFEISC